MVKKEHLSMEEPFAMVTGVNVAPVENYIYTIRGKYVMIDIDLAKLYGVENRSLRQAVRRNTNKFPDDFMFRLMKDEANELINKGVSQNVIPSGYNTGGAEMFAFTEQGVADVSITILRAFVAMRHFLLTNAQIFLRLERVESKQHETDAKIEQVFAKLEEKTLKPQQGLFFDVQVFDAYEFVCNLIKRASSRIILIDNYVDESVLTMLDKRRTGIPAAIYTQSITKQFALDIAKHDAQYPPIAVKMFNKSHDRFLIIDNQVYHIGASIKDLGKKWFAVLLMEDENPDNLISRL